MKRPLRQREVLLFGWFMAELSALPMLYVIAEGDWRAILGALVGTDLLGLYFLALILCPNKDAR